MSSKFWLVLAGIVGFAASCVAILEFPPVAHLMSESTVNAAVAWVVENRHSIASGVNIGCALAVIGFVVKIRKQLRYCGEMARAHETLAFARLQLLKPSNKPRRIVRSGVGLSNLTVEEIDPADTTLLAAVEQQAKADIEMASKVSR